MPTKYIINQTTGDMLPYNADTFPIMEKTGWRMATEEETPKGNETGYMVATSGEVAVYSKFIMDQSPDRWRSARRDEVESYLSKGKPLTGPVSSTPSGMVLRDGSDISGWKASAIREYAEKHFDPAPAWPGNMSTESLREALFKMDHESTVEA